MNTTVTVQIGGESQGLLGQLLGATLGAIVGALATVAVTYLQQRLSSTPGSDDLESEQSMEGRPTEEQRTFDSDFDHPDEIPYPSYTPEVTAVSYTHLTLPTICSV